jgi:hypothetical protein
MAANSLKSIEPVDSQGSQCNNIRMKTIFIIMLNFTFINMALSADSVSPCFVASSVFCYTKEAIESGLTDKFLVMEKNPSAMSMKITNLKLSVQGSTQVFPLENVTLGELIEAKGDPAKLRALIIANTPVELHPFAKKIYRASDYGNPSFSPVEDTKLLFAPLGSSGLLGDKRVENTVLRGEVAPADQGSGLICAYTGDSDYKVHALKKVDPGALCYNLMIGEVSCVDTILGQQFTILVACGEEASKDPNKCLSETKLMSFRSGQEVHSQGGTK